MPATRLTSLKGIVSKTNLKVINLDTVDPVLDVVKEGFSDCCYKLMALAQESGGTNLSNDRGSFLVFLSEAVTSSSFFLEKNENGVWVEKQSLEDNSLGTFYPRSFDTNQFGEDLKGYLLNWQLVLQTYGTGCYRIKHVSVSLTGARPDEYSFTYNLHRYSPERANGTVRLDFYNLGQIGDWRKDSKKIHYGGTTWYNSLRLSGWFGTSSGVYEENFVRFQNGRMVKETDEEKDQFNLELNPLPYYLHQYIKKTALQSDRLFVTDYNSLNSEEHVERLIVRTGDYVPATGLGRKLSPVNVEFEQGYQNNVFRRC